LVSVWSIRTVDDALLEGLVHIALWRAVGGGYPEPLATDVIGYYGGRLSGGAQVAHDIMLRANVGLREPMPANDWTVGSALDTVVWNPELSIGGLGDFTAYAVAEAGPGVIASPDAAELARLDEAWRNALFDESGAVRGGSKGWIIGLSIAVAIVLAALGIALWTRRVRRQVMDEVRAAALEGRTLGAVGPDDTEVPDVRAAVGRSLPRSGSRRGNPRVRRRPPGSAGVDRDGRDRAQGGQPVGDDLDGVPPGGEAPDDAFRHPGFDADD
jgi:hypothetical protein